MSHKSAQVLVVTVLFLIALGVTMLCSTSVFGAHASADDVYYDVKRQVSWLAIGGVVCFVLALVDYHWWQRTAVFWYVLAVVLLVLCFVPHIGQKINGESRWISAELLGFRNLRFQPSELGKMAMIIALGSWYDRYQSEEKTLVRGFIVPVTIAALVVLLIIGEVDMGSAVIVALGAFALMFLAGANWKYLAGSGLAAFLMLAALVLAIPNRRVRVTSLFDPDAPVGGVMLQQYLAKLAFGSGGIEGLGLGNGRLKMLYMPFAHTDFIFPMIGEELGLRITLAIVFAFLLIAVSGFIISFHARDRFGTMLGVGIVSFISLQAVLNIGVTTSLLPNTGLPLPFISYGGSALLAVMAGVGILLNIFRQGDMSGKERLQGIPKGRITPRV